MKRFNIVNQSLRITDTITGDLEYHVPKSGVFYNAKTLLSGVVSVIDTSSRDLNAGIFSSRVEECVNGDDGDSVFTQTTFSEYAELNLGFKTASGGSEAYAYIKDVKTNGVSGGTFTSGAWRTKDLNDLDTNIVGASLSANRFTLPAGTYEIQSTAPSFSAGRHNSKLRNITNSSDVLIGSGSYDAGPYPYAESQSFINGTFTILSTTDFEIQHRCEVTETNNGFGVESNFGVNEVYTQVRIKKILV